jgi:hypothetical protein
MLLIPENLRAVLSSSGALSVDEDGDEVLLGLTVAESAFMLVYCQSQVDERDPGEQRLFDKLQERHLAARLGKVAIIAARNSGYRH